MKKIAIILFCTFPFSLFISKSCVPQIQSTDTEDWFWYDADGEERTRDDLDTILAWHESWILKSFEKKASERLRKLPSDILEDILRANLTGTTLWNVDFSGANLYYADLSETNLGKSDLSRVRLERANLAGAELWNADLTESCLVNSNLSKAVLWNTKLTRANLRKATMVKTRLGRADLTGAYLYKADLTGANFWRTILSEANLTRANLKSVIFEPDSLPNPEDIAYAINLDKMRYIANPAPLVRLRNSLHNAGFKSQAKLVNAALHRSGQTVIEYILYDLTCEWGSNHLRPLFILLISWLVFWYIYTYIPIRSNRTGKYFIGTKKATVKELNVQFLNWRLLENGWYALWIACLFSTQRTLRIGFREFSPSSWLMMFLPSNFEMKCSGWSRFISGLQSLFSVAMIVLFLLSYFSRPFEF